ncbi:MAG: NRDE family protein [Pseudomonadota bacterium]|nr:NRDE family protein [Pseudomonadota bacterium]
MCIVALAWQLIPDQPVVLLANRDEFYARETQPLHVWPDQPIVAGRDQQLGGTWLGVGPNGRWAALTNYRQMPRQIPEQSRSRGLLVSEFLSGDLSPMAYARQIDLQCYEGFSLLMGTREQAVIVSNRGTAPTALASGLYVLSNALIDVPWPKTERLRQRVTQEVLPLLRAGQDWQTAALAVLADEHQVEHETDLPQTGVGLEMERLLSSICIRSPIYGTRSSALLSLTDQGYQIVEHPVVPTGKRISLAAAFE